MDHTHPREKARRVLADVLGIEYTDANTGQQRPKDDEDFYLIGGTSLLAALALESLRENGFHASLTTFATAGNIGQVLDSLFPSGTTSASNMAVNSVKQPHEINDYFETEGKTLSEWTYDGSPQNMATYNEVLELMVTEFHRVEILGHAFGLLKSDIEYIFRQFSKPEAQPIIASVTYNPKFTMPLYGVAPNKILGAVLLLPSKHVASLEGNPRVEKLQKYFDYVQNVPHPSGVNMANALTAMMLAVQEPEIDPILDKFEPIATRGARLKMHMLIRLEEGMLMAARTRHFPVIETLSTSVATKEAAVEFGYQTINVVEMRDFIAKTQVEISPGYENHKSYYLIKVMDE